MSETYNFHQSILRAYDIRGIMEETLSGDDAYYLGKAFGTTVLAQENGNKVCVGFDGRHSSPLLEEKLVRGLQEVGIDVIRVGLGPTPLLYFSVKYMKASGGIMITGSHNPPTHNGFKMMLDKLPLHGDGILNLGKIAANGAFAKGSGSVEFVDVKDAYMQHLKDHSKNGKDLKIAWDAGNGAAGELMQTLTEQLSGENILLNEKIDGDFPAHHPDPSVEENMLQLIDATTSNKCDLGIAFDGDGDRIGVVDDKGRIIWGDQLMMLLSRDVLLKTPGEIIIADVKASQLLFDDIAKNGGKPLMWKTGHSLIKTKMFETGAVLSGEMSGHIFFRDNNCFDDGLYAAVRVINMLSNSEHKLSYYVDQMPELFSTAEVRIDVTEERKFVITEEVKSRLKAANENVNDIDGVRVNSDEGWWLLRASNTQASLVARCESDTAEGLKTLQNKLLSQLKASNVDFSF